MPLREILVENNNLKCRLLMSLGYWMIVDLENFMSSETGRKVLWKKGYFWHLEHKISTNSYHSINPVKKHYGSGRMY